MYEQFLLKIEQKQAHARSINRIAGHQLGVWKTLVNVFIDDV